MNKSISSPLAGSRILVVDDNEDYRILLHRTINRYGAKVTVCASGIEALSELKKQKFEVLLSDLAMPEMDGHDLIIALRSLEEGQARHTPAVALSGHTDYDTRRKTLSEGFQVYLNKPFNHGHLIEVLERLIEFNREAVEPGFGWKH